MICTSATQATIHGRATIDGSGSVFYRLNVEDNDSGNQTRMGGNVQIHRS